METKIAKEFKYSDLGIDIILKDVVLYKVNREWLPKIDVEKLSKRVFSLLTYRAASFSGNELFFIRTYLQMSKSEFGRELKVSHTAVAKWEKSGKKISSMDIGTELLLKMIMAEKSGATASKYQEIYKKTKEHTASNKQEQLVLYADAA
jgi:DNA-binding transcriptional regulator YiaG